MVIECWVPATDDVAVPKDKAAYHVVVVASDDDTVLFYQVTAAKRGPNITNRLSTFVDRFELLYRAEETPDDE